jgi:ferredoxin-type protein NapH
MVFAPIANFVMWLVWPLCNVLVALPTAYLLRPLLSPERRVKSRLLSACTILALVVATHLLALNPRIAQWLVPLTSPIFAVFLVVVLPAIHLPPGKLRRAFMIIPAIFIILAVVQVVTHYTRLPADQGGFYGFPISPWLLMSAAASLCVLASLVLPIGALRWFVRLTCFAILMFGGFLFRTSVQDYRDMLTRRMDQPTGIMNLSETSPVLQSDTRMLHLPSAPCRFPADGGYVQGCPMELLQRVMQVNYARVGSLDVAEVHGVTVLLGALVVLMGLLAMTGRWFCGWVCPLATAGKAFEGVRRACGIDHVKSPGWLKGTFRVSGISLASITLLMARLYPRLDANGCVFGLKLPVYPFCKICPAQQVCPTATAGPGRYPGIPGWQWGAGFFTLACAGLLAIFILGFTMFRQLFCRLCPMGLLGGHFNHASPFKLTKDPSRCNGCGICADVCPMDIERVRDDKLKTDVLGEDCLLCFKCVERCPRDKCLSASFDGRMIAESKFGSKGT